MTWQEPRFASNLKELRPCQAKPYPYRNFLFNPLSPEATGLFL